MEYDFHKVKFPTVNINEGMTQEEYDAHMHEARENEIYHLKRYLLCLLRTEVIGKWAYKRHLKSLRKYAAKFNIYFS